MRHIRHVSLLMLIGGIVLAILGEALDLGPAVTLVGLLLVVAGIVKIVTIRIWRGLFVDEPPETVRKGASSHE